MGEFVKKYVIEVYVPKFEQTLVATCNTKPIRKQTMETIKVWLESPNEYLVVPYGVSIRFRKGK